MSLYQKQFTIKERDFIHAGDASVQVKNILKGVGADPDLIRRVAIASYEAEMNAVIYAHYGQMSVELHEDCVRITVEDQGPGIPDVTLAMQDGYSTATPEIREMGFGAGMGLPNIKKNSDEFLISSQVGHGTKLEMVFNTGWRSQRT
ncbi:MAG: anti-sigma regulatory factor [Deltaproteobacteria bacterium]|nr:anti-sigma regulatory factor [Deltaproteobacteria bacterium]